MLTSAHLARFQFVQLLALIKIPPCDFKTGYSSVSSLYYRAMLNISAFRKLHTSGVLFNVYSHEREETPVQIPPPHQVEMGIELGHPTPWVSSLTTGLKLIIDAGCCLLFLHIPPPLPMMTGELFSLV